MLRRKNTTYIISQIRILENPILLRFLLKNSQKALISRALFTNKNHMENLFTYPHITAKKIGNKPYRFIPYKKLNQLYKIFE